jgi:putative oxidoreductase
MNILLWVLQFVLGIYFLMTGLTHFTLPPGLPGPLSWMYELSPGLHYFSGTVEILGGLGLILPGLTRIQTRLISLAGLGLMLVMLGAAVWHLGRGELQNIVMNLVLAGLCVFVAYGRWRLRPLKSR